jgi:hypothetical protein
VNINQPSIRFSGSQTYLDNLNTQLVVKVAKTKRGPKALGRSQWVDTDTSTELLEMASKFGILFDVIPVEIRKRI